MAIMNTSGLCNPCVNVVSQGGGDPCACIVGGAGLQAGSSCNCSSDSTRKATCTTCVSKGTGCKTCTSTGSGCATCTSGIFTIANTPEIYYFKTEDSAVYPVAIGGAGLSNKFGSTVNDSYGQYAAIEYGRDYYRKNAPLYTYNTWSTPAYSKNGTLYYAFDFSKFEPAASLTVNSSGSGASIEMYLSVTGDVATFLFGREYKAAGAIYYYNDIVAWFTPAFFTPTSGLSTVSLGIKNSDYYSQDNSNASWETGYHAEVYLYNTDLGYSAPVSC